MAIPIPSEERSQHPKLFRAREIRTFHGDPDVLHRDAAVRRMHQEAFTSKDNRWLGADEGPRIGLKHVPAPDPQDTPVRKRPAHQCAPLTDDQILHKLFPIPGGMSEPPMVRQTAEMFAAQRSGLLQDGFSESALKVAPNNRRTFPELRAAQEERSRSGKGDLSIAHTGVRLVPMAPVRAASTEPVAGFKGMGVFSHDIESRRTGLRKVVPFSQPWDPLELKAKFNSGGHPLNYYT